MIKKGDRVVVISERYKGLEGQVGHIYRRPNGDLLEIKSVGLFYIKELRRLNNRWR